MGPNIYVGPHLGTVPVLELDKKNRTMLELDVFIPVGAPCLDGTSSSRTGPNFCPVLELALNNNLSSRTGHPVL